MDERTEQALAHLIRNTRTAALGTLHDGAPNLAMVAIAHTDDLSAFYIHVSRLGKHTRDMEADSRVSLLFVETDDHRADPQTLARFSLNGTVDPVPKTDPNFDMIKHIYLTRFPTAEPLFGFGDFGLWRISPKGGRFVAGFAQAFNITPEALKKISAL